MSTLPIFYPPDNDEAIKALIRQYAPGVTAEGAPARLYAVCGSRFSNDVDFVEWLNWTNAFPFVILSCGRLIWAITPPEAWDAYMFLKEWDVNPSFRVEAES